MRPDWEPPLSNSLQGSTLERRWRQDGGAVEVRMDRARVDGVLGSAITVRRVGNVTWRRWRATPVSAAELFEKAVDRVVRGEEMGSL